MFKSYLKKLKMRNLRKTLRGYQRLKKNGNLQLIGDVQRALLLTPLDDKPEKDYSIILGELNGQADFISRQYLFIRLVTAHLPRALLKASARHGNKIVFPLPLSWQAVMRSYGIPVSQFKSSTLWLLFNLLMWGYGVISITKLCFQSIREVISPKYSSIGKMVHFEHLSHHNFPKQVKEGKSYDFVSWYLNWQGNEKDLNTITHRAANIVVPKGGMFDSYCFQKLSFPLLPLGTVSALFRFIFWASCAITISFFAAFTLTRSSALLLSEAALAKIAILLPREKLAEQYFFNNSGAIYRPLWTYEASARGVDILLYFYSTNCEGFDFPNGKGDYNYARVMMNWPSYLVWNSEQLEFIERSTNRDFKYVIVGPIWFSESTASLPQFNEKSISVFDVQPMRQSVYHTLGLGSEYYVPEHSVKFINDVVEAAKQTGHSIYWKQKRNIGKKLHPSFVSGTKTAEASAHVIAIEPEISANRVIEQSDMVISMPFTSTALIAKHMGKPSCYYDASGLLQPDDKGAHNIPIIQDQKSLTEWIQMNSIKTN